MGSYGIHVDSQLKLLRKIKEAKEFAKAVKADNAEIPLYLWNDRIRVQGIINETRDAALTSLRKMGHRRFMKSLVWDCVTFMWRMHCQSWGTLLQSKDGMSMELGRDWEVIAGMLWHNVHTTWFDSHAGSRLVHLRFPILFRTMARDGVPVWFERPGPTTQEAQPQIVDAGIRVKAKENV
jgi:hypothetical protein